MTPLSRDLHPSNGRRTQKDEVVVSITTAQLHRVRRQAEHPQEPLDDEWQDPAPDERRIELLRLLAEGSDDEMAARRLGVELAELRQILMELGAELGACNRFQLALRALEAGWV